MVLALILYSRGPNIDPCFTGLDSEFTPLAVDGCIEWQVNYGYQKFHEFIIKIQKTHQKMPFSLSSIHDQNTIFIQISHIAKSHTHKSIFGSTQTINQLIQCIYCQLNN